MPAPARRRSRSSPTKYFRGSLGDLVAVRAAVGVPVLRKEFILDEYQLWSRGPREPTPCC